MLAMKYSELILCCAGHNYISGAKQHINFVPSHKQPQSASMKLFLREIFISLKYDYDLHYETINNNFVCMAVILTAIIYYASDLAALSLTLCIL